MGQKINPLIFRLNKRQTWSSFWKAQNVSFLIFKEIEFRYYLDIIANFLDNFLTNTKITKSTKRYRIHSKLVNNQAINKTKKLNLLQKNQKIQKNKQNLVFLSKFNKNFILDINKFYNHNNKNFLFHKKLNLFSKYYYFPFLSAQTLSNFIAIQLETSVKKRDAAFKNNIKSGILNVAKTIFNKKTCNFIAGIKIVCKGKWIKTATGRKQKLTFSLGKLNNQTVLSLLDYGFSTAQTPYGSCGLKVWICFRPKIIKKRF